MTLLELQYTVQHIAQVFGKSLEMSLEQFNNLTALAQNELFKEFAEGYSQGNGAEVDSRVSTALIPFKYNTTYFISALATNSLGVNSNSVVIADTVYKVLSVVGHKSAILTDPILFDILTAQEVAERITNSITLPTMDYPVCATMLRSGGGGTLHFIPTGFYSAEVVMLNKPTTPVLVETMTNGIRTQHVSSVGLQFDSIFHVDIARKMLQYLGLSIGNDLILSYLTGQKMQEK